MLISYCCGNLNLLQAADLSEINEIIDYLITKENDETLLEAYKASYAALQNIPFDDFRRRAMEKLAGLQSNAQQPSVEAIHKKAEHFIDDYQWKEV